MNCHTCPNALLGLNACALLAADRELLDCSLPRSGRRDDCPHKPRVRLRMVGGVLEGVRE